MTSGLAALLLGGWTALIAVGVCVGRAVWELAAAGLGAVWRRLGPWRTGDGDGRLPTARQPEPARLAYWWRQMWVDASTAARHGMRTVWRRLADVWLRRTARN
ncbi:hypothetical protein NGM37_49165, partial [Streptomyces sp. TRM76130]|nr:hypothetical protein [Streptomyces sp. TRM76130]